MKKFLEIYKKINFPLMLAVTTVLLVFSPYASWLWIVALVLNFGFYLSCSITQMLCATMYFEFFSGIGIFFVVSTLEMLAIIIVRYIVGLSKKREKFYIFPFVLTIIIIVIFSCIHYDVTVDGFLQGAILISFLISSYFIFVYHKSINVSECFRGLILGMIVSLILATIAVNIPDYPINIISNDGRWYMFALNVNHISMLCLFAIAFYIQQINLNKGTMLRNLFCIIFSTCVGITTLSKAFLVVWMLLMIYLFVSLIIKFKKKSLIVIIPLAVFFFVIAIIFRDKVISILKRFFYLTFGDSILDKILTGRVSVWRDFLEVIISSVWTLLFGVGLFTQNPAEFHTHNSYLFLLHRFGFIGIILLMVLIYAYAKNSNTKFKLTVKNSLILFVFLLLSCEELLISERFMFFFFFVVLIIAHNGEDFEPKTTGHVIDYVESKFYFYLNKLYLLIKSKLPVNSFNKGQGKNVTSSAVNVSDSENKQIKEINCNKEDFDNSNEVVSDKVSKKEEPQIKEKQKPKTDKKVTRVVVAEKSYKNAQKSSKNNQNN